MNLLALAAAFALSPAAAQGEAPALSALKASVGAHAAGIVPGLGPGAPVAAPPAAAGADIDLSGQFPTGSRDQADVGSCHAFASIGLLEAAYFRKTGEHAVFSDADLFLRNTVLNGNVYTGNIADRGFTRTGKPEFKEGGSPSTLLAIGDMEFAIKHGVATTPQYSAFLERYRRYREAEQRTLEDIERQHRRNPWLVRLLYNPRKHWTELQKSPTNQRILQNFLMGNDQTLDEQRAATRGKLAGLSVVKNLYVTLPSSVNKAPADCAAAGANRTASILSELRAGRPVGVSYFTDANWASHVIIIVGAKSDGKGGTVFKTRNSWGAGGNADMFPHDMCKAHGLFSVR